MHLKNPPSKLRQTAILFILILTVCLQSCGINIPEPLSTAAEKQFDHNYAEVNGVRLHYAERGEGELILFLHGFPELWYTWREQLVEFGKDHHAVAPDMRGYNLSSKPKEVEQYRILTLVEDIRSLVEHLGYKRFVLVAHDWGGAVAWAFAIVHPEYLSKLVILNAPHASIISREMRENPVQKEAGDKVWDLFRSDYAEFVLTSFSFLALRSSILEPLTEAGYLKEEDLGVYYAAWSQPDEVGSMLRYYRANNPDKNEGIGHQLDRDMTVRVPTLIIWGEQDEVLLTGNLKGIEKYVPDVTIVRVPDADHWIAHQKPKLVSETIRKFLRR